MFTVLSISLKVWKIVSCTCICKFGFQNQYRLVGSSRQTNEGTETFKKSLSRGFPGGAVVKNPSANAGDTGSSPGLGRSHMPRSNEACAPQLLSLRSRACEPQLLKPMRLEPMLCNKRSHHNKSPLTTTKSSPCSPQLEKACAQQQRPNTAKNK